MKKKGRKVSDSKLSNSPLHDVSQKSVSSMEPQCTPVELPDKEIRPIDVTDAVDNKPEIL